MRGNCRTPGCAIANKTNILLWYTAAGVGVGLVGGYALNTAVRDGASIDAQMMTLLAFPGDMLLRLLRLIVLPLVVASMVCGVASLGNLGETRRMATRTAGFYMLTTFIAVVLGLVLVNLIKPGVGIDLAAATPMADMPTAVTQPKGTLDTLLDIIRNMFPSNIFAAAVEFNVLALIVFSLIFGGALLAIGEKAKPVLAFFDGVNEAMFKIVHLMMWYAPIGIASLVAANLGTRGDFFERLGKLGLFAATVIGGLGIHLVVVLPLIYWFKTRRNPFHYLMGMSQALLTAFSTASSAATLPVTIDCAQRNGISKRTSGFVLPLGATVNMDGTAMYEAIAPMFIAQAYGIDLSLPQMGVIVVTATLASVGAAAIPQAGLITMVIVLTAVGLPIEGIGLFFVIDWFLDRFRTAVNVAGDSVVAAVVDEPPVGVAVGDAAKTPA